jgi:small subunit ribosomal protein S4
MRRLKKKYKKPKSPWDSARIEEERTMMVEYGLKKKTEIWKAAGILREFRRRARSLISVKDKQKVDVLMAKLRKLGLMTEEKQLEDVLTLKTTDILERRLQTMVYKKKLAATPKQARQFIVHGQIAIDKRRVKIPSYLVTSDDENKIGFYKEIKPKGE